FYFILVCHSLFPLLLITVRLTPISTLFPYTTLFRSHITEIKDYAVTKIAEVVPGVKFNGRSMEKDRSLYTVLSVLLPFKDPLIGMKLDMQGIAISQGSACSSGASKPSMVMLMLL